MRPRMRRPAPLPTSASAALLVLVLAIGAQAADRAGDKPSFNRHTGLFEPPLSELERSVERGDRAEIARWAERIGPARLVGVLHGSDRSVVLAALEAAAALRGSARLLEATTPLAASSEPGVAERAVRALGAMLDGSEPRSLEDWDVPADAVARACKALSEAATRPGSGQAVRLAALDALTEASGLCHAAPLGPLLIDPAPAVRRAALLALRPRDDLQTAELQKAIADSDPGVVSAGAVAWCRRRLAAPASAPLAGSMLPLLRALAQTEATTIEDAVELLPCVAGSTDQADRQALEQLKRSKVPLLRTRATELAGGGGR
jgi:hypothetical protein